MNPPLFAIRPEPGLADTIAAGAALGLEIIGEPLFAVEAVAWEQPHSSDFDALLVGSANVFRCGGESLASLADKPVYAVGQRTAEAASAAGFTVVQVGRGGLQRLLDTLPRPMRLLRPAGEARVDLAPPQGISIVERAVYRSAARPLPKPFAARLRKGGTALLHSAEAGRHFAAECDRLGIPRGQLALVAIGPRVLEAVGAGWAWTAAAPEPSEAALLALARDMCLSGEGLENER